MAYSTPTLDAIAQTVFGTETYQEACDNAYKKDYDESFKIGYKEGKLETAQELVKRGVTFDIIVASTGIPRAEIEEALKNTEEATH